MSVTDAILREGRPVALAPLPSAIGWREHAVHPVIVAESIEARRFVLGDLSVVSAVEHVEGCAQYHISIALVPLVIGGKPRRAPEGPVKRVIRDFGLEGWGFDEDNHASPDARARNLWLECPPDRRAVCPCKADEPATAQAFGDETGECGGVYVHRDQVAP